MLCHFALHTDTLIPLSIPALPGRETFCAVLWHVILCGYAVVLCCVAVWRVICCLLGPTCVMCICLCTDCASSVLQETQIEEENLDDLRTGSEKVGVPYSVALRTRIL